MGNSLVIGTGAVILGENMIQENKLTTSSLLIDLHIIGSKVPDFLKAYLPDIDNTTNGKVFKYLKEGQNRIIIIGDSVDSLIKIINDLPDDFLEST